MQIICTQCQTHFRVDDKYLTSRGIRVQCPRCEHIELLKRASTAWSAVQESLTFVSPLPEEEEGDVHTQRVFFDEDVEAEEAEGLSEEGWAAGEPEGAFTESAEFEAGGLWGEAAEAKPSLEGWEFQPTQTIIGPSAHCRLCGKALEDSFEQALEVCELCRHAPLNPRHVALGAQALGAPAGEAVGEQSAHALLEESPLTISAEMEALSNQYTPPYEFEAPLSLSNMSLSNMSASEPPVAVQAEPAPWASVWFWLRWVCIGCAVALLVILLFLAVFFVR